MPSSTSSEAPTSDAEKLASSKSSSKRVWSNLTSISRIQLLISEGRSGCICGVIATISWARLGTLGTWHDLLRICQPFYACNTRINFPNIRTKIKVDFSLLLSLNGKEFYCVCTSTLAAREHSLKGPPRKINNLLAYLVHVLGFATQRCLIANPRAAGISTVGQRKSDRKSAL
jgi:hypothetical protein